MMQFRSNTKLEEELGSRTGFRKKNMREPGVPDTWKQGKADAIVQRKREKGKDGEGKHESVLLVFLRPSVIEFCLPLQSSFSQSTYLNASLFQTRDICIQKG